MLNEDSKHLMFTTPCLSNCPYMFIVRPNDPGNGNIRVIMTSITEDEEKALDSRKSLRLKRGKLSFYVDPDFCLAYGDVDLSPNSKDTLELDKADWFSRLYVRHFMPSEYDYETHSMISDIRGGRWYDTSNIKTFMPYLYACIGKPKKIIIFKEYIDIIALNRAKRKAEREAKYYQVNKDNLKKRVAEKRAAKRRARLSHLVFNFN